MGEQRRPSPRTIGGFAELPAAQPGVLIRLFGCPARGWSPERDLGGRHAVARRCSARAIPAAVQVGCGRCDRAAPGPIRAAVSGCRARLARAGTRSRRSPGRRGRRAIGLRPAGPGPAVPHPEQPAGLGEAPGDIAAAPLTAFPSAIGSKASFPSHVGDDALDAAAEPAERARKPLVGVRRPSRRSAPQASLETSPTAAGEALAEAVAAGPRREVGIDPPAGPRTLLEHSPTRWTRSGFASAAACE
jgi:hypothetical protein